MMICSKIHREFVRLWLQAVCGAPCLFPRGFRDAVKKSWNGLQLEEGRRFTKGLAFPEKRGAAYGLDIRQTSGFGEAVHPDVIYVPDGFGAEGWTWLMTVTPFPGGIVYFENPEFLVSRDGLTWRVPDGAPSPLVAAPSDWIGYNSDPSLLYDGGRLYLFYREVRSENNHEDRIRFFVISSGDGVNWSEPRAVFDKTVAKEEGALLLSPTLLKEGGRCLMWYVEPDGGEFVIKRGSVDGLQSISGIETAEILGLAPDDRPWHIDVVRADDDSLIMALCVRSKSNGRRHSIVFAKSAGGGMTWRVFGERIEPDESLNEKSLYRASLARAGGGAWKLYYSCQDMEGHWFPVVRDVEL